MYIYIYISIFISLFLCISISKFVYIGFLIGI